MGLVHFQRVRLFRYLILRKKTRLFCSLPSCRIGRLGLGVSSYPDFSPLPLFFFFRASFSGLRSNHVVVVMRSPNNHDSDGNGNEKVKRAEGDNFARAHKVYPATQTFGASRNPSLLREAGTRDEPLRGRLHTLSHISLPSLHSLRANSPGRSSHFSLPHPRKFPGELARRLSLHDFDVKFFIRKQTQIRNAFIPNS